MKMEVLTEKQQKFCELYVTNYNAAKSYAEAFQRDNDCTSRTNASRLLKEEKIQNYIKRLQDERVKRWGDISKILLDELMEDVCYRDEDEKHNGSWQKSVDLLQKQLGLTTQKIDANVNTPNIKVVIGDEDE